MPARVPTKKKSSTTSDSVGSRHFTNILQDTTKPRFRRGLLVWVAVFIAIPTAVATGFIVLTNAGVPSQSRFNAHENSKTLKWDDARKNIHAVEEAFTGFPVLSKGTYVVCYPQYNYFGFSTDSTTKMCSYNRKLILGTNLPLSEANDQIVLYFAPKKQHSSGDLSSLKTQCFGSYFTPEEGEDVIYKDIDIKYFINSYNLNNSTEYPYPDDINCRDVADPIKGWLSLGPIEQQILKQPADPSVLRIESYKGEYATVISLTLSQVYYTGVITKSYAPWSISWK